MPKQPSNKLFYLINALSPKEQEQIRILIKVHKNETTPLLKIFDCIAQKEIFSEPEIFESLKDDLKTLNNFRVRKAELYDLLLDLSSKTFKDFQNVDTNLLQKIESGWFLIKRGLLAQALPVVNEGIELARNFQRSLLLLQLLRLKSLCLNNMNDLDRMDDEADAICGEAINHLNVLGDFFEVSTLELHSQKYLRKSNLQPTPESIGFFEQALKNKAYSKRSMDAMIEIKLSYLFKNLAYREQTQISTQGLNETNWNNIANEYKNFLTNLSAHEIEVLQSFPGSYLALLNNYVITSTNSSLPAGAEALKIFLHARFIDKNMYRLQQAICFSFSLRIANSYGDDTLLQSSLSDFGDFFRRNESKIPDAQRKQVYLYLGEGHFIHHRFDESKQAFRKIIALNVTSPQMRQDITRVAHLLMVLIGYETGKSRATIFRTIRLTREYLAKTGGVSPIENALLTYFRESIDSANALDQKERLKELITYLELHSKDDEAMWLFSYFQFDIWFSCKLTGDSYHKRIRVINKVE